MYIVVVCVLLSLTQSATTQVPHSKTEATIDSNNFLLRPSAGILGIAYSIL